ncbi:plasmodium vivax PV1H14065_P-related, putative [Babesia ovis]|uniref:Plasmodium vivax PV1H14065_P-related, putative n=1 Tax=Babesia ovis TaxID=5869 RepID=A0A9W5TEK9_BABOV|nr:plasmodium vivax PV1H14065_P-related, putative [Babesia ovis]
MFRSEVVAAVFAAHEGSYAATQRLHQLVECREDPVPTLELQQQLVVTYDVLISLTQLPHNSSDEAVLSFVSTKGAAATRENYVECVDLLRFYGFTLLVKLVENHWHNLPEELRARCKHDAERLFSCGRVEATVAAEYNTLAVPKVTQFLATIAIREWPVAWVEFVPLCLQSINSRLGLLGTKANGCKQTLAELCIFGGLLSEVAADISDCMDNKVLYKKRTQILGMLQNHMCDVFLLIRRVIMLGMMNGQPQMLHMVINIFRNLSLTMEGVIFVAFDVDEFLTMNANSVHRSDIIQTMHNICSNLVWKPLKNMPKRPDFDIPDENMYKGKLGRFLRNIVSVGESIQLDSSLDTACDELHLAQALKSLFDRNGLYILGNVDHESLKLLCDYVLRRLVMHPSMQIAICAVNGLNIMLRRMSALGGGRLTGEYVGGVFVPNPSVRWLDHRQMLLVLFVRCLKMGNAALQDDSRDHTSSATIDTFIADAIGTPIVRSQRWSKLLFAYVPIDDEFCVGHMKNFEPRFASLRSTILNCVSLLCTISHDYMNLSIKALADIFTTAQSVVMDSPCVVGASACTLSGISEKRLQWTCKKLVLFDGTCFMFEAALSRLRSATIDATVSSEKTKVPEWLQPAAANKVLHAAKNKIGGEVVDNWISSAMTYLLHMLGLQLPSVHSAQLEIRRLGMLASSSHLLLFNPEPMERILEYVVGLLLLQNSGTQQDTRVCRSALVTLIALCKNCSTLVSTYVEPIVQRIRHCLSVAEDESARDLLLESLVALTSCLQNYETQKRLTHEIIAPHVEEIKALASKLSSVKTEERPAMLFDILYGPDPSDGIIANACVGSPRILGGTTSGTTMDNDSLYCVRRNLRRVFTMSLSILRCSAISHGHNDRTNMRHPLEELLPDLVMSVCTVLTALSGMWRPAFRGQNNWRKAVLSPGEEEWIALQGFNEAIASEESLRKLVESVFSIPANIDAKLVRKCRRHDFLIRQSALKLCGEIFSTAATQNLDLLQPPQDGLLNEALVEPLEWISMFHLAQFLKFALVPSKLSLRHVLPKMISTVSERINSEWKALSRVQRNLLDDSQTNETAESRIMHLYYLRVYACIETGLQLMSLVATIFRARSSQILEGESQPGTDDVIMGSNDQISVVFGSRELLTSVLQCLCSALCWPHCRCIMEALRLLRAYARTAPTLDKCSIGLAEVLAPEALLVLHKQLRSERTFDPLNLGNDEGHGSSTTAYKRFWSNTRDGSANYIKEFVNTMCSFYECLVRCQPGVSAVVVQGEINVQALLGYKSLVDSVKLLTPYLQEHECLAFLTKAIAQNTVETRALLQAGVEANVMDQNVRANAKMTQLSSSVLETRSSREIEYCGSGESDDEFLGSDIMYLLFE